MCTKSAIVKRVPPRETHRVAGGESLRPVNLIVPLSFDPSRHLPGIKPRWFDHGAYFVHRVTTGAGGKVSSRKEVPLHAKEMTQFFPSNPAYDAVRKALLASGAILCNGSYEVGVSPKRYALGREFEKMKTKLIPVAHPKLAGKLRDDRRRRSEAAARSGSPLAKRFRSVLGRLSIDEQAAIAWVAGSADEDSDCSSEYRSIEAIALGEFWVDEDDFGGRFHTNLTNLKSGLRGFLRIDGKPLVGLDVRNSQPLILAGLVAREYRGRPCPEDVARLVDLTQQGRFYDDFMEREGWDAPWRDVFKRTLFSCFLFCRVERETDLAMRFAEHYPSVYEFVRREKSGPDPDAYKGIARLLMRTESEIVVRGAARSLLDRYPDAPVLTLHDAIYTTEDFVEVAEDALKLAFLANDLRPKIKVEPCRQGADPGGFAINKNPFMQTR